MIPLELHDWRLFGACRVTTGRNADAATCYIISRDAQMLLAVDPRLEDNPPIITSAIELGATPTALVRLAGRLFVGLDTGAVLAFDAQQQLAPAVAMLTHTAAVVDIAVLPDQEVVIGESVFTFPAAIVAYEDGTIRLIDSLMTVISADSRVYRPARVRVLAQTEFEVVAKSGAIATQFEILNGKTLRYTGTVAAPSVEGPLTVGTEFTAAQAYDRLTVSGASASYPTLRGASVLAAVPTPDIAPQTAAQELPDGRVLTIYGDLGYVSVPTGDPIYYDPFTMLPTTTPGSGVFATEELTGQLTASDMTIVTADSTLSPILRLTYQYQLQDIETSEGSALDWGIVSWTPPFAAAFLDGLATAAFYAYKFPASGYSVLTVRRGSSRATGTARKQRVYRVIADIITNVNGQYTLNGTRHQGPIATTPGQTVGFIAVDWVAQTATFYPTDNPDAFVYVGGA